MSIIYAVIARGTETTLVDYEALASNFPKLVKTLLTKIKLDCRSTYIYSDRYSIAIKKEASSYHFHYINEADYTYLCLTDRVFPKRAAFAFLEEIKSMFSEKFDSNQRSKALNYGMNDSFGEFLKAKIVTRIIQYNSCTTTTILKTRRLEVFRISWRMLNIK
jgi:vesicle-associated membrane protein 7